MQTRNCSLMIRSLLVLMCACITPNMSNKQRHIIEIDLICEPETAGYDQGLLELIPLHHEVSLQHIVVSHMRS